MPHIQKEITQSEYEDAFRDDLVGAMTVLLNDKPELNDLFNIDFESQPEDFWSVMDESANEIDMSIQEYIYGKTDLLDICYEFIQSVLTQCGSDDVPEESVAGLIEDLRSAMETQRGWNNEGFNPEGIKPRAFRDNNWEDR